MPAILINFFSLDYDAVSLKTLKQEATNICNMLRQPAVIQLLQTSPGRYSILVKNTRLSLRVAIKIMLRTACSEEYKKLVLLTGAFYLRTGNKISYDSKGNVDITPKPKVLLVMLHDPIQDGRKFTPSPDFF